MYEHILITLRSRWFQDTSYRHTILLHSFDVSHIDNKLELRVQLGDQDLFLPALPHHPPLKVV